MDSAMERVVTSNNNGGGFRAEPQLGLWWKNEILTIFVYFFESP